MKYSQRYHFKFNISRGKVKPILKKLGIYNPTCFVVINKNSESLISFHLDYKISNRLQNYIEKYLNSKKYLNLNINKNRRNKKLVNYDESLYDQAFEIMMNQY